MLQIRLRPLFSFSYPEAMNIQLAFTALGGWEINSNPNRPEGVDEEYQELVFMLDFLSIHHQSF